MTMIPEYQDVLSVANIRKGKLPIYVIDTQIHPRVSLHHHDFAEFLYVVDGHGTEIINGTTHELKPGTASFLLPHHIHEIRSRNPDAPVRLHICMFDISMLFGSPFDLELIGQLLRVGDALPSYVDFPPDRASKLRDIFQTILDEYVNQDFGKYCLIRNKLLEGLILFSREQRTMQPLDFDQQKLSRKLSQLIQYVHLHYTDRITLESLSERFHTSPPHISQSFKKFCGCNFLEYLHKLRIGSALSLLASTDMLVSDIATEVGFDSYRSFTRVFKKLKNMTPQQFRESLGP